MDFKNCFCPVCNKNFTDDDDIVVCPECGTPHHRDCYNTVGKCFNAHLHSTSENIESTFQNENSGVFNTDVSSVEVNKQPETEANGDTPFIKIPDVLTGGPAQTELIDGEYTYLYEIAVNKNREYYIPRFMLMDKVKKAFSFNFVAFLTPFAWTLYRKMYKFAAIVLAVYVFIFGMTGYFILSNEEFVQANAECLQEDPDYLTNIALYTNDSGNVTLTVKQQKLLSIMEDLSVPTYVSIISSVLLFGIRIYLGLFANKKYMQKLKKNIKSAVNKGLQGDTLKNYLYRKYGTLPFILAGIVGFVEIFSFYL